MKAYFVLRDFFNDALNSQSMGIKLKSYRINDIETLTPAFFIDTQSIEGTVPINDFGYCRTNADGSNPVIPPPGNPYNNFNPFAYCFKTVYPIVNGFKRGMPIGTENGNDYGAGVMKFGVDKAAIITTAPGFNTANGGFFLEIDFTQNLYVEFDVITNWVNNQMYDDPYTLRTYKIEWNIQQCLHQFSYLNYADGRNYIDNGYGFLKGIYDSKTENPLIDFSTITCGQVEGNCDEQERTRSFAMFLKLPDQQQEYETIKECCYGAEVLAQTQGNDYEKNDYTGIYHLKQLPNESANFFLVNLDTEDETALNNDVLGTFKDFGTITGNANLKTFVLQWKKVLVTFGEGNYTIVKRTNIAGLIYEESLINYNLHEWSTERADDTVRMDVAVSGYMENSQVDFTNSNFVTSLRFGGFFGRREPKYEEDTITYANYEVEQISMQQTNEYTMQSTALPSCITQQIIDFMLFANDIFINDYNLNNHLRTFVKFPVKFGENKGTNYYPSTTKAVLNLTFIDKKLDNLKRNY